jgi:RND family efflux transporter MFP subunit
MDMEPVYADETPGTNLSSMPPGTVKITPEKQQLIGVQVGVVEEKPVTQTIRLLGRVATDETRVYIINATIDGWMTKVLPYANGTLVKKRQVLAAFYSPEFLSAEQALIFALGSKDRVQTTGSETPAQQSRIDQFNINLRQYTDTLRNLGMGEDQIKEMIRTRKYIENVDITSPADGFIIARNVSEGQRFDKGTELYRIADLSRVWILADLFENEAELIKIKPGARVTISLPYQNKTLQATVSNIIPQFDKVSRTMKVRLEADNPGFVLKPDMFVDVEFPVTLPPTMMIPVDAILDSGLKKTVFVDRGNGFFEPRDIEAGWRIGGKAEIVKGLMAGERIVISGTFLVDSESRMKLAAAGIFGITVKDPVCGMVVNEDKAEAAGLKKEYRGQAYYFCAEVCLKQFSQNPDRYIDVAQTSMQKAADDEAGKPEKSGTAALAKDPVCGMQVAPKEAEKAQLISAYRGNQYYFCCESCKQQFDKNPGKFIKDAALNQREHQHAASLSAHDAREAAHD